MKKVVLFAFNGKFMCFIHVLLNALDMNQKSYDVRIVIEGAATKFLDTRLRGMMYGRTLWIDSIEWLQSRTPRPLPDHPVSL